MSDAGVVIHCRQCGWKSGPCSADEAFTGYEKHPCEMTEAQVAALTERWNAHVTTDTETP